MSTLHTVNKSPFQSKCLRNCLDLIAPDDALLLIEDGTYALKLGGKDHTLLLNTIQQGVKVYALNSDALARGLKPSFEGITAINEPMFVELCCKHQRIQSWY